MQEGGHRLSDISDMGEYMEIGQLWQDFDGTACTRKSNNLYSFFQLFISSDGGADGDLAVGNEQDIPEEEDYNLTSLFCEADIEEEDNFGLANLYAEEEEGFGLLELYREI